MNALLATEPSPWGDSHRHPGPGGVRRLRGYLLKAVRELRQEASGLAREAGDMLGELDMTVHRAGHEVERVDRMVGSAEAMSDAGRLGAAPRGRGHDEPFIKVVAFSSGVARGLRLVRGSRGTDWAERARGGGRRKNVQGQERRAVEAAVAGPRPQPGAQPPSGRATGGDADVQDG